MKPEESYQRPEVLEQQLGELTVIDAKPEIGDRSVAIVVGRWHQEIADGLLKGALDAMGECGISVDHVTLVYVPGAYEIPLAAKKLADTSRYAAIVALGAVIRGDTPHFDYVAGECVRGISDVSMEFDVPVAFGVLTVDNVEQARVRSRDNSDNKGREAALAALEMVRLLAAIVEW